MRDWAESLSRRRAPRVGFEGLLRRSLRAAEVSLGRTPASLEVLARAGVVDAGAQGFVRMLEGVVGFIRTGRSSRWRAKNGRRITRGPRP
jgi:hypothetical protein